MAKHRGKHSGLAGQGAPQGGDWSYGYRQKWHPTPRWAFWRPAWRRLDPGTWNTTHSWEYQTHKQRARDVLEKSYDPAWAYSRGGQDAQGATGPNLSATQIKQRFNSVCGGKI